MVRVERIELSSQVWKTCILTVVLHSQNPTIYFIPIAFTCQNAKTKDRLKYEQTLE